MQRARVTVSNDDYMIRRIVRAPHPNPLPAGPGRGGISRRLLRNTLLLSSITRRPEWDTEQLPRESKSSSFKSAEFTGSCLPLISSRRSRNQNQSRKYEIQENPKRPWRKFLRQQSVSHSLTISRYPAAEVPIGMQVGPAASAATVVRNCKVIHEFTAAEATHPKVRKPEMLGFFFRVFAIRRSSAFRFRTLLY